MKSGLFILVFFLFVNCNQALTEKHYKSDENVTGGFNNFFLDLESNGNLILTIETFTSGKGNLAGASFEPKTKKVTGEWNEKKGIINYTLNETRFSIDSIFMNTDYSELIRRPVLSFSAKSDTAFVYGIPCILQLEKK